MGRTASGRCRAGRGPRGSARSVPDGSSPRRESARTGSPTGKNSVARRAPYTAIGGRGHEPGLSSSLAGGEARQQLGEQDRLGMGDAHREVGQSLCTAPGRRWRPRNRARRPVNWRARGPKSGSTGRRAKPAQRPRHAPSAGPVDQTGPDDAQPAVPCRRLRCELGPTVQLGESPGTPTWRTARWSAERRRRQAASNSETLPNTFERQMSALRVSVMSYAQWTSRVDTVQGIGRTARGQVEGPVAAPRGRRPNQATDLNPADPNASTRTDPR